ncbi:MAG: hypothetical protein AAFR17_15840 [Pseudomonadota bacterium]
MTEEHRFGDLKKIPPEPAAKIMARGKVVLQTKLDAPASASVGDVLAELEEKGELIDMLHLLAHALPPREATWWACLSGRDIVPEGTEKMPPPLQAAEDWVFKPNDETRTRAREALDNADNEDETMLCAMAATFADGTLGPGELEDYEAPPGAVGGAAFGMALTAMFDDEELTDMRGPWILERGLDIARGGNGKVEAPEVPPPPTDEDLEDEFDDDDADETEEARP